jgi:hypothetical protein
LANSTGLGIAAFCLVGSLGLFLLNMQSFSHSPARQIASAIPATPADTTIIYDFGEDAWWNTYYPVRLRQGADRRQIMVLAEADRMTFFNPESYMPSLNGTPMPELNGNPLADSKSVVLIRARSFDLGDMRRYVFGKTENIEKGAIETKLAEMNGLTVVSEQFVPGTTSARIIVMQKK